MVGLFGLVTALAGSQVDSTLDMSRVSPESAYVSVYEGPLAQRSFSGDSAVENSLDALLGVQSIDLDIPRLDQSAVSGTITTDKLLGTWAEELGDEHFKHFDSYAAIPLGEREKAIRVDVRNFMRAAAERYSSIAHFDHDGSLKKALNKKIRSELNGMSAQLTALAKNTDDIETKRLYNLQANVFDGNARASHLVIGNYLASNETVSAEVVAEPVHAGFVPKSPLQWFMALGLGALGLGMVRRDLLPAVDENAAKKVDGFLRYTYLLGLQQGNDASVYRVFDELAKNPGIVGDVLDHGVLKKRIGEARQDFDGFVRGVAAFKKPLGDTRVEDYHMLAPTFQDIDMGQAVYDAAEAFVQGREMPTTEDAAIYLDHRLSQTELGRFLIYTVAQGHAQGHNKDRIEATLRSYVAQDQTHDAVFDGFNAHTFTDDDVRIFRHAINRFDTLYTAVETALAPHHGIGSKREATLSYKALCDIRTVLDRGSNELTSSRADRFWADHGNEFEYVEDDETDGDIDPELVLLPFEVLDGVAREEANTRNPVAPEDAQPASEESTDHSSSFNPAEFVDARYALFLEQFVDGVVDGVPVTQDYATLLGVARAEVGSELNKRRNSLPPAVQETLDVIVQHLEQTFRHDVCMTMEQEVAYVAQLIEAEQVTVDADNEVSLNLGLAGDLGRVAYITSIVALADEKKHASILAAVAALPDPIYDLLGNAHVAVSSNKVEKTTLAEVFSHRDYFNGLRTKMVTTLLNNGKSYALNTFDGLSPEDVAVIYVQDRLEKGYDAAHYQTALAYLEARGSQLAFEKRIDDAFAYSTLAKGLLSFVTAPITKCVSSLGSGLASLGIKEGPTLVEAVYGEETGPREFSLEPTRYDFGPLRDKVLNGVVAAGMIGYLAVNYVADRIAARRAAAASLFDEGLGPAIDKGISLFGTTTRLVHNVAGYAGLVGGMALENIQAVPARIEAQALHLENYVEHKIKNARGHATTALIYAISPFVAGLRGIKQVMDYGQSTFKNIDNGVKAPLAIMALLGVGAAVASQVTYDTDAPLGDETVQESPSEYLTSEVGQPNTATQTIDATVTLDTTITDAAPTTVDTTVGSGTEYTATPETTTPGFDAEGPGWYTIVSAVQKGDTITYSVDRPVLVGLDYVGEKILVEVGVDQNGDGKSDTWDYRVLPESGSGSLTIDGAAVSLAVFSKQDGKGQYHAGVSVDAGTLTVDLSVEQPSLLDTFKTDLEKGM
jgi:hypothetical protein